MIVWVGTILDSHDEEMRGAQVQKEELQKVLHFSATQEIGTHQFS